MKRLTECYLAMVIANFNNAVNQLTDENNFALLSEKIAIWVVICDHNFKPNLGTQ